MNLTDEIIKRLYEFGFTENGIRIVLNDYDIRKKETRLTEMSSDKRRKAVQMFLVTKKVEGCTESTIRFYSGTLRKFFNEIDFRITDIGADQIRYYFAIRSTRDGLSKTSQDNELRILKSFFKWCTGEDYIKKDPTVNIKAIKKEKKLKKPFTETELELISRNAVNLRDRSIIEVLYSTGVRVSELCGMDREDMVDDEIVVFGKGEKERVVYLNARARLSVREYLNTIIDSDKALFVGIKTGKRLGKSGVETMLRETGRRAGVGNCHPHRFRRTAGTLALNRGMPLEQVQQMLGHEKIETTTIYARSAEKNVKASHEKYVV